MNAKEFAYETIKRKIMECEYMPGDVLSENEIKNQISVGRTPIREALNKLENENLVRIFPKRGIFVSNITVKDVLNIYDIREVLEVYAVELASANLTEDQLLPYLTFYQSQTGGEGQSNEEMDKKFHTLIYDGADNNYLCTILKSLYDQNTRIRRLSNIKVNNRRRDTGSEHLRIIEAILAGDTAKAKQHMKKHVQTGRKVAMTLTG